MTLKLYNTLTKREEEFKPIETGRVTMYNCGPTVYSFAHIGNFASFVMGDLLRRYLEYSGYEVTQIMNITDVGHLTEDDVADACGEDKLEKAARERQVDIWDIAREYEKAFHEDRRRLNLLEADKYPRATDHVPQMQEMISELLELDLAYVAGDQVYFAIDKFPYYGRLSGNTTEQLVAGARVAEDERKQNPLDFALWKKDPDHLMKWDSPWGEGFPGWHIECSAMAREYLGEKIDIHTGGEDNIFPHHECEIAQSSRGQNESFANYWLHRRHIFVEGKKMSKSARNFYTVRDLLEKGYDGLEIRYSLVSLHYRANSNFTFKGLDDAKKSLRYLREFRLDMRALPKRDAEAPELDALEELRTAKDEGFRAGMDADLNTSVALAKVREFCAEARKICTSHRAGEIAATQLENWDRVLGVLDPSPEGAERGMGSGSDAEVVAGLTAAEVQRLVDERAAARQAKDFGTSDRIRDELLAKGVVVKDGPDGSRWHVSLE